MERITMNRDKYSAAYRLLDEIFGNSRPFFVLTKDDIKLLKEAVEKATLQEIDQLTFLKEHGDLGNRLNFFRSCLEGHEGLAKELEAWEWCRAHVPGFNRKVKMIDPD